MRCSSPSVRRAVAWASAASPHKIYVSEPNAHGSWTTTGEVQSAEHVWSPTVDYLVLQEAPLVTKLVTAWVQGQDPTSGSTPQAIMQWDQGEVSPQTIKGNVYSSSRTAPHIVAGSAGTHLVFAVSTDAGYASYTELYHTFRPTGDTQWPSPQRVLTRTEVLDPAWSGRVMHPRLALDGSTVHLVWQQMRTNALELWYEVWYMKGAAQRLRRYGRHRAHHVGRGGRTGHHETRLPAHLSPNFGKHIAPKTLKRRQYLRQHGLPKPGTGSDGGQRHNDMCGLARLYGCRVWIGL